MNPAPKPTPLCEAIVERIIAKSDPLRDSENAGMMHVNAVAEIVWAGFASLTVDDLAQAMATLNGTDADILLDEAKVIMTLLRKE